MKRKDFIANGTRQVATWPFVHLAIRASGQSCIWPFSHDAQTMVCSGVRGRLAVITDYFITDEL
jgi:hypothetical protein